MEQILTKEDIESSVWKKIQAYYFQRIDELRKLNDKDMNEIRTACTRGKIHICREILAFNPENEDI